jgi:hypothetical protein
VRIKTPDELSQCPEVFPRPDRIVAPGFVPAVDPAAHPLRFGLYELGHPLSVGNMGEKKQGESESQAFDQEKGSHGKRVNKA